MKTFFSSMIILLFFLTSITLAESLPQEQTVHPYLNPEIYVFGTKTPSSRTFVYNTTLNDERVLRIEFNVDKYPYQEHFELEEFSQVYNKLMPEVRHQSNWCSINTRYLTPINQTVEVTINELGDDLFDTSISVNTVAGLSTAPSPNGYSLLAFTSSLSYTSQSDSLQAGIANRSEAEMSEGLFMREWYVVD